ncbi:MAG: DUF6607 family protein [Bacteroidota bacterium]
MNRTLLLIALVNLTYFAQAQSITPKPKQASPATSNLELDKSFIKKMCGIYKVTFDFAETFSSDSSYKYYPRYKEWGIEYVFVAEETPNKIVLQHLLIANDSIIIKHWAQEWVYENTELYSYYRDNEWIQKNITTEQAKGTWTQKVYQVDDSPRYESYGTWVHVNGKHYWEGSAFAPLPRREYTKRSDYNVMGRNSRMEIYDNGWALIQDNEKIERKNGIDKTIAWEKGIERFWSGNYNATPAIKWWNKQQNYWADVRKAWDEVYVKYPTLKIKSSVDKKRLFDVLFDLGEKSCQGNDYTKGKAKTEIDAVILSFITTGS